MTSLDTQPLESIHNAVPDWLYVASEFCKGLLLLTCDWLKYLLLLNSDWLRVSFDLSVSKVV